MTSDIVEIAALSHRYGKVAALTDVELALPKGKLIGVIGPDGVGKSTLLSIIAGVTRIQSGSVQVLGGDMTATAHRTKSFSRIAFMPQGLGQNLYGDLSVEENILFFASLFEIPRSLVDNRIKDLLAATELAPFADRRAANLSGGMKQKLGLCCILIHEPDLIILDEPTTGVDPLSRRNFWELIRNLMKRKPGTTVLVATAYMDEADTFDWLVMMEASRIFATGPPTELKSRSDTATLEDAFEVLLLGQTAVGDDIEEVPRRSSSSEVVIEATNLTRKFGDFTAVDQVNFQIRRGEIYGFIGPNGCGKTTTMKMLTGLLPPSSGDAHIFGKTIEAGSMELRRRLGYMSQLFSLYSELTVKQNLDMHGRLFGLRRAGLRERISELTHRFDLGDYVDQLASDLPVGLRQRLSLAVAVIHQPELLILDEPTSGVDPLARDKLWKVLRTLSDSSGTTIFVSTHYLGEAERCDRVALMNQGRLLAADTPGAIINSKAADSLEEAFVAYINDDRARSSSTLQTEGAKQ
jgi:ribosome-dependent ATPase